MRDEDRPVRAADDDWDDGRVATRAGVEIAVGGELQKQLRPLPQPRHAPRLALDDFEPLEGRRHVRRRAGRGEDERRRRVAEVADEPLVPGKVAAAGAQSLADRPHPQIPLGGIDAKVVADPAPPRPHRAHRMGLIDVEHRVVTTLDLKEPRQIGVIAIHAVDPLDRHDDAPVFRAEVAQQGVELVVIVVAERTLPRLRGPRPLDHAVVGQLVIEDQILRPEEVGEDRSVRAVAAREDRGRLGAEKRRQFPIEVVEEGVVAADHPARRGAAAEAVDGGLRRPRHVRMAGEPEVVEAREADDILPADPCRAPADSLVGPEEGIGQSRLLEAMQPGLEGANLRERIGPGGRGRHPRGDGALATAGRWLGGGIGITGIDHVAGNAVDEIAAGLDAAEPIVAEAHLVAPLDPVDDVEEGRIVEAGVSEGRAVGEAPAPTARLKPRELLDHQARDRRLRARADEGLRPRPQCRTDRHAPPAVLRRKLHDHALRLPTRADASRSGTPDSLRRHRRRVSHAPPAVTASRHGLLYRNDSVPHPPRPRLLSGPRPRRSGARLPRSDETAERESVRIMASMPIETVEAIAESFRHRRFLLPQVTLRWRAISAARTAKCRRSGIGRARPGCRSGQGS